MTSSSPGVPSWQRGRVAGWLVTVDHKRIGILYIATAGLFFALSGFLALLIRSQLATADGGVVTGDSYNEVVTMHGTGMVFFVVVPILAGLGNYLVPLMIGARDMAFPRLNALSYWLYAFGGIVFCASFFAAGGAANTGWTAYPPLSVLAQGNGQDPDPLAAHPHALLGGRGDQLHRHDPQHAGPRHVVDAPAALRLVDRDLRGDAAHRAARAPRPASRCSCSSASSPRTSASSGPRTAARRSSTSTSSGSSGTPRCTS